MKSLVWFRSDLRLADNPAFASACRSSKEVVAAFCLSARQWRSHDVGDRRIAFLLRALRALSGDLAERGIALHMVEAPMFSDVPAALLALAQREGVEALHFNAEYPLNERRRDEATASAFSAQGKQAVVHHGTVLQAPRSIATGAGKPYTVFTPFKRRWLDSLGADGLKLERLPPAVGDPIEPAPTPERLDGVSISTDESLWKAGEARAKQVLARFVRQRLAGYAQTRDLPGTFGTSVLSPYLAIGNISPKQCLAAIAREEDLRDSTWGSEIIWREFYRHVIASFDHVSMGYAFRREYDQLAWERDASAFEAWCEGRTGYPLVDAGLRQLNETGWMHNRVRMVTAMFLSKHLLLDWRLGERYFMQRLVDGDFASNNGGWQWSASTGTDAAPYFRIFNPTAQGQKFDGAGAYVRRWVPELKEVPDKFLFEPHSSGMNPAYPAPIVDHRFARARAIERFKAL